MYKQQTNKQKDKADSELMIFIQSDNSIQRLTKASFTGAKREHTKGVISKTTRQTILDMGYCRAQTRRHQNKRWLLF